MCSIVGGLLKNESDFYLLDELLRRSGDRGRDGGRLEKYKTKDGLAFLSNWRAAPTTELFQSNLQPYDKIVHNGTIANDKELMRQEGHNHLDPLWIDSMVLPYIIKDRTLNGVSEALKQVLGSYAIAVYDPGNEDIILACNYKPIYFYANETRDILIFSSMERHFQGLVPYGQRPAKLKPYSIASLKTGETIDIERKFDKKAIVIASAGLDSTTVASILKKDGYEVCLLHFLYGCNAETREAELIPQIAEYLDCQYAYIPIDYSNFKGASPLFNDSGVSQGVEGAEFAYEWVPARNLLMMSLATAYAEANGYHVIALGNNLEEAGAYPDNEEEFTTLYNDVLPYSTQNGYKVELISPLGNFMKHEIVGIGLSLGTPYHLTWSCYNGGRSHCGNCGPCFMRKEAFKRNNTTDPVFKRGL